VPVGAEGGGGLAANDGPTRELGIDGSTGRMARFFERDLLIGGLGCPAPEYTSFSIPTDSGSGQEGVSFTASC